MTGKTDGLDRLARISLLFDLYGGLLTDKKREVLELYHEDDMTLAEIAGEQGVSRAAVYDALTSAEKSLDEYERRLGLLSEYMARQDAAESIREITAELRAERPDDRELAAGLDRILELVLRAGGAAETGEKNDGI